MSATQLRARSRLRKVLIQTAIIVISAVIIWGAFDSARTNLAALGLTNGFGFLERSTGWNYSFSLIPRDINDSYARTLWIGFMNTVFVGFVSIILSTIFGFLVGTARGAQNLALNTVATIYVQIFRNVPLILQMVFLYSLLIHMPPPREALNLFDTVFMSSRGVFLPLLNMRAAVALACFIASMGLLLALALSKTTVKAVILLWLSGSILLVFGALVTQTPSGEAFVVRPSLQGLRFEGGLTLSVELVAMIVGIVLYGSAYVAEVVRGGLNDVPKGLTEAGQALGLSGFHIWSRIKLPMALRMIIPPLGNQWIFIMKATTIGVAIGFSDLFMLVSTSITQSGQTLELIAILMLAFLLVNFTLAQAVNWLNARLQLKAH
jgi:His/Glu/Gln/Arg/opine family amino acid ABC transporter permease subunit